MNELTDPEREAVAVAREKIGTGGYALFNRLYLEFGGYRAEMHFAHGYLVALTQLDALRAELLAANEQITQLRGDLRALRCGADAEFQAALADAVNDEVLS